VEIVPCRRRAALRLLACTACGDRIDETILSHRRRRARQADPQDWKQALWERIRGMVAREVPV